MQKPGRENPLIEHFEYAMTQIEDERKEDCIHCGERWYTKHHKDGVCHSCQSQNLPSHAELARRRRQIHRLIVIIAGTVIAIVFWTLFK